MADHIRWAYVLKALLPEGRLFDEMETPPAQGEGPVIWLLLKAFGKELERLELRIHVALAEMDPRTATETLDEWEKMYGLPDVRVPVLPSGTAQRRAVVVAKVISRGAQNAAAYELLINACGWELIELRKVWTFPWLDCESEHDGYVGGMEWALTVEFLVGGETLDSLPLADLTRVLQFTMQLHAYALVTYVP
jgi:uncharacterized protein YmfQ (DUF2313 family)